MSWPGARDLLFSLKAFAAAMLAFWIACAFSMPRPVWAVFTVYILMQPISGAVRSRSVYRMIGTVAGAVIAVLLTALLADFPAALFLSIGFAALIGFFISTIIQTARGYAYLMAGITAALIGLPDAVDPILGFSTAMARTGETLLGIACATGVDSVFWPHPAGAVLNARVTAWLDRARNTMLKALRAPDSAADRELGGLAADAAQLDSLASFVAYDIVPNSPSPRIVRLLHTRMLLLIRLMFSVHDWAPLLRHDSGATPKMLHAIGALSAWLEQWPPACPDQSAAALRALDDLRDAPDGSDAALVLRHGSLGILLHDLMLGFQDCVALQRAVTDGGKLPDHLRRAARSEPLAIPYRDPLRAVLVLLPVALAFLLVFAYWTVTGWDQGRAAAMMTLVAGLFASSSAEPSAQATRVVAIMALALAVAIFYQFAVLPAVQDFPPLVVALGLFFVPAGAFIPVTKGTALILTALTALMLSLQPEYEASFASATDGALGTLAGLAATAVLSRISLVPGTAWTTRHLLRAGWSDLAAIAARRWHPGQAVYALRALDRFTVLAPQLEASGRPNDLTTSALLGELRIGLNMLRLRDVEPTLPASAQEAIDTMLLALTRYFDARRRDAAPPVETLREPGTLAMAAAAAAMPAPGAQTAWLMLAGVQRSLFGSLAWPEMPEAAHAG